MMGWQIVARNTITGYQLHNEDNLNYLPDDAVEFIRQHVFAFNHAGWTFWDFHMYSTLHVKICEKTDAILDKTHEWLYDFVNDEYVLSERYYNGPFTLDTIIDRELLFADVLDRISS